MSRATVNNIFERQSSPPFRELWKASSQLYNEAKAGLKAQAVLVIVLPVAMTTLTTIIALPIKPLVALYGLAVSMIDAAILQPRQRQLRKKAAVIQEKFDCDLLSMKWNFSRVGREPEPELVAEYAGKYGTTIVEDRLRAWYSEATAFVPPHIARFLCQRENITWDARLRRRYTTAIRSCMFGLVVGGTFVGVALKMSVEDLVMTVLSPGLPVFLWLVREWIQQNESVDTVERLKECVGSLWIRIVDATISEKDLEAESRNLQDLIFDHRNANSPIPDFFYEYFRDKQEEQQQAGTEALVTIFLEKKS
jgi:hypothetical protein